MSAMGGKLTLAVGRPIVSQRERGGMKLLGLMAFLALAILAVRGRRWAYIAFALTIPLSFLAFAGFRGDPNTCELAFDLPFIVHALPNYPHIVMFAFFFMVTAGHFRFCGWQLWTWGIGLTMAMGAAMEIAQGLSGGTHHCKAVDLVPDFIGALLGLMLVFGRTVLRDRVHRRSRNRQNLANPSIN